VGGAENQNRVSLAAHEPLEIAQRFPHSRSLEDSGRIAHLRIGKRC
jgi:hypothetical protein